MATKKDLFEGMTEKEIQMAKTAARRKAASKKVKEEREDRVTIHTTKVRIDLRILRQVVKELEAKVDQVGWERKTKEQRSAFHSWNTVSKFAETHDNGKDFITLDVEGARAGSSLRVYYNPSLTSYCKEFRKCIVPLHEGNKFIFFDLKAAEFFLNCWYAGESEALEKYAAGEDIYTHYAHLFPEGTPRAVIKQSLIGNLYGLSAYRLALNCGISESQADRILATIQQSIPRMTLLKSKIISMARKNGYYVCPNGLDTTQLIKAADFKDGEFNPLLALSAYTQSGLSVWMHQMIHRLDKMTAGTLLTVFDSMLIEVRPENVDRAKAWIIDHIKPFRAGDITVGSTFYEAYKG